MFEIYNPSKQYVEGNKVSHNGSSYYCIKDSLGNVLLTLVLAADCGKRRYRSDRSYGWGQKAKTALTATLPVKGTDYFTDADKSELVAAVLAEIPVVESEGY